MTTPELILAAEADAESAYAVDSDLRLTYTNSAWEAFARANGGEEVLERWVPGALVTEAFQGPLRSFFTNTFRRVIETNERFEHEYDCGSAVLYRRLRMVAYPLAGGGVLVCNARVVESARGEAGYAALEEVYGARGYITQCGHCRRVSNPTEPARWDWVPAYVSEPRTNISHSLCPPCVEVYYPEGG